MIEAERLTFAQYFYAQCAFIYNLEASTDYINDTQIDNDIAYLRTLYEEHYGVKITDRDKKEVRKLAYSFKL